MKMKKTYTILMMLAGFVAMTVAACNDDLSPVSPDDGASAVRNETVSVQLENPTKVTLSGDTPAFAWEDGDQIAVWTGSSNTSGSFQSCEVTSGSINVSLSEGCSRCNFAIYPASVKDASNYGQSTLNVILPASYAHTALLGTKTPLPMVAVNTGGTPMTFYNLGGLLRVTVKAIPTDATGLVFQFPGKKVNGTFVVTGPGTSSPTISTTTTPSAGEDKITVTFTAGTASEMTLNIPLPTGTYDDVYITPVGSETKVAAARHVKNVAGGYTAARAHGVQLTATLVSFSVSSTKKVIFSPGNLQAAYDGTSWSWHFAAQQYDRIGASAANTKVTDKSPWVTENGSVDLFGWSTSTTYFGINSSTDNGTYSNGKGYVDWGSNVIDSYAANYWRTLTGGGAGEWRYLFDNRTIDVSKKWSTVNGIRGLILMPDSWSGSLSGTYSLAEWKTLEEQGAVFLPAAGYRNGTNCNEVGGWCYYNTSSYGTDANNACFVSINNSNPPGSADNGDRKFGRAVRLVHDIE